MTKKENIFRRLDMENSGRSFFLPCLTLCVLTLLLFFALFTASFWADPYDAFSMAELVTGCGGIITAVLYLITRKLSKETKTATAQKMDKSSSAKNRLEAAMELKGSSNPLRKPQFEQTENFYNSYKQANWRLIFSSFLILMLILLSATAYLFYIQYSITYEAQKQFKMEEKSLALKKQKKKKKAPEIKDFAELTLTSPESEIRAKAMDEIAWDGTGRSSKGFEKISMSLYVNGKHIKDIPVEEVPLNKKGEIKLAGEFYLDELDVVPFDLVSYHLSGWSTMNGKKKTEIIGVPQFIEVRPFKEEAIILKLLPGEAGMEQAAKMINVLNIMTRLLRFQLALNKAAYAVRASGISLEHDVIKEQLNLLVEEQKTLHKDIRELIEETPPEMFSPNMFDRLQQASVSMEKAALLIEEVRGVLPEKLKDKEKEGTL